ncbi:MAG: hypothetical protein ACRD5G_04225 [Candidatus Acidiferrales bacterium]
MVFIESRLFARQLKAQPGDAEMEVLSAIQQDLLKNPGIGVVIPGLGGVRKARAANPHRRKGKRGGSRYFYYYFEHRGRIYLLYLLDKDERDDLSDEDRALLRSLAGAAIRDEEVSNG